jgi:hypothetical protein
VKGKEGITKLAAASALNHRVRLESLLSLYLKQCKMEI